MYAQAYVLFRVAEYREEPGAAGGAGLAGEHPGHPRGWEEGKQRGAAAKLFHINRPNKLKFYVKAINVFVVRFLKFKQSRPWPWTT